MKLTIRPLTPDLWPALEELFGDKRNCGDRWCMFWRIGGAGAYRNRTHKKNKAAFREAMKGGPPPLPCIRRGSPRRLVPTYATRSLPWLDRTCQIGSHFIAKF